VGELTRAWKKLARRYHPDRHAGDPARQATATRLLQDLHHAYRELAAYLGRPSPKPRK
jgi:curved DNA-binding protein CbpA